MTMILTRAGLEPDHWKFGFVTPDKAEAALRNGASTLALDLRTDFDVTHLDVPLERIDLIRITLATFVDGRAFSQAALLRLAGFGGRLRAAGDILPDQFPALTAAGFDEIELGPEQLSVGMKSWWIAATTAKTYLFRERLRQFDC